MVLTEEQKQRKREYNKQRYYKNNQKTAQLTEQQAPLSQEISSNNSNNEIDLNDLNKIIDERIILKKTNNTENNNSYSFLGMVSPLLISFLPYLIKGVSQTIQKRLEKPEEKSEFNMSPFK